MILEKTVLEETYGWGVFAHATIHYHPTEQVEIHLLGLHLAVLATKSHRATTTITHHGCLPTSYVCTRFNVPVSPSMR